MTVHGRCEISGRRRSPVTQFSNKQLLNKRFHWLEMNLLLKDVLHMSTTQNAIGLILHIRNQNNRAVHFGRFSRAES